MKVQVLIAAMNQTDTSLLEKMNIQSDAIVGNQCDKNSVESFEWKGHNITYLNFAERGVGLNRNNSLMRATGDICLFADDDMVYCDDYVKTVTDAFSKHPEADVIVFNLIEPVPTRHIIKDFGRVRFYNFLRYGTARIAFRTASVKREGIYFNQCFGGGTEHAHGEDNLFLASCLQKRLKVFSHPAQIASLTEERESSWNAGYDEKYLKDQGILYKTMTKRWWRLLCLQDAIRHSGSYGLPVIKAYKIMSKSR